MLLSKDDILNAQDRESIEVDVPEWGGKVRLMTMSGLARDRFEASFQGGNDMKNIRARLAAATIVDENGSLLFSEKDVSALGEKSGAALDRVFEAAQKLNRIGERDIEELSKN